MTDSSSKITHHIEPNNIKKIRKFLGITAKKLGQMVNRTGSAIAFYEDSKRKIPFEILPQLLKILNCTKEALFDKNLDLKKLKFNSRECDLEDVTQERKITIPLFNVRASAGKGNHTFNPETEMEIDLKHFMTMTGIKLSEKKIARGKFSLIKTSGDSMVPKIHDGDIIMIDHEDKEITEVKKIFVFKFGEEWFIKQLSRNMDGTLNIISFNSDYESYLKLNPKKINDQFGEMNIVGKVIWRGTEI